MKKYTIELVLTQGCDEFWEEATRDNMSGCDDVLVMIREILARDGFEEDNCSVKLIKFEDS